jgi:hypothetical protein
MEYERTQEAETRSFASKRWISQDFKNLCHKGTVSWERDVLNKNDRIISMQNRLALLQNFTFHGKSLKVPKCEIFNPLFLHQ